MSAGIRFLLVEDDANLAQLVVLLIANHLKVKVDVESNGWKGLDQAMAVKYDLVILDIMLPGMNGLSICKKLRQYDKNLPLLLLTAKSEELDKLEGFEVGADEYITKPFSQSELIARIKALMRRSNLQLNEPDPELISLGDLRLDIAQRVLKKNNTAVELTAKEFDLIHFFMKNPGRAFSRQQLLDEVWGAHFNGLEHTVNSTINRLRAKIEEDLNKPIYIITAWGIGYRFMEK